MAKRVNRLAYIIGNDKYEQYNMLSGSINDTILMETTLRKCGFTTKKFTDLSYKEFSDKVYQFKFECMNYNVGLFYFAGHGFEYRGENYLCPTDSKKEEITETNVNITNLLNEISKKRDFISIIILDCCRTNIESIYRDASRINDIIPNFKNNGGTFIAYATNSGDKAIENNNHGLFTQTICKHITKDGEMIEQVFKNVRKDVMKQSNLVYDKIQIPWEYSSLVEDFYFVKTEENVSSIIKKVLNEGCSYGEIKDEVYNYCINKDLLDNYPEILYSVLNGIDNINVKGDLKC